jgi:hypothetical protein
VTAGETALTLTLYLQLRSHLHSECDRFSQVLSLVRLGCKKMAKFTSCYRLNGRLYEVQTNKIEYPISEFSPLTANKKGDTYPTFVHELSKIQWDSEHLKLSKFDGRKEYWVACSKEEFLEIIDRIEKGEDFMEVFNSL